MADDEERIPLAKALSGMEVQALEAGWTPLEAFVFIKCLNDVGETAWASRTTHALNREELLGALSVHNDVLRKELVSEWFEDSEDF